MKQSFLGATRSLRRRKTLRWSKTEMKVLIVSERKEKMAYKQQEVLQG